MHDCLHDSLSRQVYLCFENFIRGRFCLLPELVSTKINFHFLLADFDFFASRFSLDAEHVALLPKVLECYILLKDDWVEHVNFVLPPILLNLKHLALELMFSEAANLFTSRPI